MSLRKKINIVDFKTLEQEKQRLRAICDAKKSVLDHKLEILKQNYPEVAMKTLLPFDDATNDSIFRSVRWLNEFFSNFITNSDSKFAKLISGKGMNILQTVLIYTAIRIGKNFLSKHR